MTRVILLAVALAIAVVTAVLVRNFLARQDGDTTSAGEATVPIAVPKVEVLVAAGDLPAGTRLEAASVRWQGWPEDGVNPDYVTRGAEGAPESFDGFVVRRGLLAGEPVLASKLIRPDAGDLLSAVLARIIH